MVPRQVSAEHLLLVASAYTDDGVAPLPEVVDFVFRMLGQHLETGEPIAALLGLTVASSSPRISVLRTIRNETLQVLFDTIQANNPTLSFSAVVDKLHALVLARTTPPDEIGRLVDKFKSLNESLAVPLTSKSRMKQVVAK